MAYVPPASQFPGPQTFSIGGIAFDQMSNLGHPVPSELESGYEAWGSVKRVMQSDGSQPKKIVQLFGVFPIDYLKFRCIYLGQQARQTYRNLVALMEQMTEIQLVDADDIYKGVLFALSKKKLNRWRLEIEITFAVRTTSAGVDNSVPQDPQSTLSAKLQTIGQAATDADLGGNALNVPNGPTLQEQLLIANATGALGGIAGLAAGLFPELAQPISTLVNLVTQINEALSTVQMAAKALEGNSDAASIAAYGALQKYYAALTSYNLTLQSVTGLDGRNAVASNGADLYTIASTQLGDVNRVGDLLACNPHITDPFIVPPGPVNLPTI